MRGHVEEHVGVLGRGVFRSVRRREAHDQHERPMGMMLFGVPEEMYRVVGHHVRVIVLRTHRKPLLRTGLGGTGNGQQPRYKTLVAEKMFKVVNYFEHDGCGHGFRFGGADVESI